MKKIILLTILLTILAVLTGGCSRFVRKAVHIPNINTLYEPIEVHVATDYYGVKHILRKICLITDSSSCLLEYSQATSGTPIFMDTWGTPTGYHGIETPDIAVTDSGVAAFAWQSNRDYGGGYATLYMLSSGLGTINEIDSGYNSTSPLLVSRGETIYAVHNVEDGTHGAIRYRQLVGGSAIGWVSEHGLSTDNAWVDAAVSPDGKLYVLFFRSTYWDIMYADNYSTTGDMTNRFGLVSSASNYTFGRIDVNGIPAVVYVTYTRNFTPAPGVSDVLVIGHCPANNCGYFTTYEIEQPLDSAKEWNVLGNADIIADAGNTAYYVFQATNSDTATNVEIFEGYFQDGLPHFIANVSNTPGNDGMPSIGLMWSIIPVAGWVAGGSFYQFDAYPFNIPPLFAYASLRNIHQTTYPIITEPVMSCNADWGAGAWIEEQTENESYVIFNVYPALLPMIKK
jgi:hypothetical protein